MVTYEVGLPVGCLRIGKVLFWLKPYEQLDFPVFSEYLEATRGLPMASDRLLWNVDSLRGSDKKLEAINAEYRNRVFDACFEIIQNYASPKA